LAEALFGFDNQKRFFIETEVGRLFDGNMNLKTHKIIVGILGLVIFMVSAVPGLAGGPSKEIKITQDLYPALKFLLNLVSKNDSRSVELNQINAVMAFVDSPKDRSGLYYAEEGAFNADSAYTEFDVNKDIHQILKLTYHPDIPPMALMPSSLRLSYWKEVDGRKKDLPRLWEKFPNGNTPYVLKGVEHEEITPDSFSGAYYKYDLKRTLILFEYMGRKTLISLSKQVDVSEVGKKGLILEPDENWNYLYSGKKGVALPGLGWVESYMYDSYSIMVITETAPGASSVKCGFFKWVRAGWKSLNMVKKTHIYSGQQRFAKTFKTIVESPFLPDSSELANACSKIEKKSFQELRLKMVPYMDEIKKRLKTENGLSVGWASELVENGQYASQLTKKEMESIMILEHIKGVIGKEKWIDTKSLVSHRTVHNHLKRR
jgi:hypothetical protein